MTRKGKFLKNSSVTLLFFLLSSFIAIFSRKIYLEGLGEDALGLNTTIASLMDFISLLELGLSASACASLYGPLATHNEKQVSEIAWIIQYFYRYISYGVLVVGFVLGVCVPFYIDVSTIPIGEVYCAFTVFVLSVFANYYWGYGRIVFQADQKNFIPVLIINASIIIKNILQMVLTLALHSYLIWLLIEVVFNCLSYLFLKFKFYKNYPYVSSTPLLPFKKLVLNYQNLFVITKQNSIHSLAGFVSRQSNTLIIAFMLSLSSVTLWGNYCLINSKISSIYYNVSQNAWAGIGDMIAVEKKEYVMDRFKKYYLLNWLVMGCLNISYLFLISPLIELWLGRQYVISSSVVFALVITNLLAVHSNSCQAFLAGYRLFGFVWVPIMEAVANIIVTIIAIHFWGLSGAAWGGVATGLICSVWKPVYLFRYGFCQSMKKYLLFIQKLGLITAATICFVKISMPFLAAHIKYTHFMNFLFLCFVVFMMTVCIMVLLLLMLDSYSRSLVKMCPKYYAKRG